jgi:hypothetical protein
LPVQAVPESQSGGVRGVAGAGAEQADTGSRARHAEWIAVLGMRLQAVPPGEQGRVRRLSESTKGVESMSGKPCPVCHKPCSRDAFVCAACWARVPLASQNEWLSVGRDDIEANLRLVEARILKWLLDE